MCMKALCLIFLFLTSAQGSNDGITANFDYDTYKIAERGKPLNLTCTNNVNDLDINTWKTPDDVDFFITVGKTSTLNIPSVTKDHIGIYTCEFTYSKDGDIITEKKEIQLIEKPVIDLEYIFESDRKIRCKVDSFVDTLIIESYQNNLIERRLLQTKHIDEDIELTVGQDKNITYICEAFSNKAGNVTAKLDIILQNAAIKRGSTFKENIEDKDGIILSKNLICIDNEEETLCKEDDGETVEDDTFKWVNIQEYEDRIKVITIIKVEIVE